MDQLDILKTKNFAKGTISIAEKISKNTKERALVLFLEEEILCSSNQQKQKKQTFFHTYQQQEVLF